MHIDNLTNVGTNSAVHIMSLAIMIFVFVSIFFGFIFTKKILQAKSRKEIFFHSCVAAVFVVASIVFVVNLFVGFGAGRSVKAVPPSAEGINQIMLEYAEEVIPEEIKTPLDNEFEQRINERVDHDAEIDKAIQRSQK